MLKLNLADKTIFLKALRLVLRPAAARRQLGDGRRVVTAADCRSPGHDHRDRGLADHGGAAAARTRSCWSDRCPWFR